MVQHFAPGFLVSEQFVYVHTVIKRATAEHIEHHNHLSFSSSCILGGKKKCRASFRIVLRTNFYNS